MEKFNIIQNQFVNLLETLQVLIESTEVDVDGNFVPHMEEKKEISYTPSVRLLIRPVMEESRSGVCFRLAY